MPVNCRQPKLTHHPNVRPVANRVRERESGSTGVQKVIQYGVQFDAPKGHESRRNARVGF
jgi:hypothetical protein